MIYSDATPEEVKQIAEEFPSQLVVLLYDEAIENLNIAIGAIEAGDIQARFMASEKVAEILYELCIALDMENGGEIAENLAALYKHGIVQMTEINFTNDADIAQALMDVLEPLRDAWVMLDERIRMDVDEAEAMMDPAFTSLIASQQAEFFTGVR